MIRALLVVGAALILATGPALAKAELVLVDGSVLTGASAERRDELFLLRFDDGSVAAIPAANVKELRLIEEPAPAPAAIVVVPPRTLAGVPPPMPPAGTRVDQLGAFPDPVPAPRPSPIDPAWAPTDAFAGRGGNDFRPARWYRAPIDPNWTPVSAFTAKSDVTNFRPARWTKVMESIWVPKDGFADAPSNPRRKTSKTPKAE